MSDKPTKLAATPSVAQKRELSRAELEAELDVRSDGINRRVSALESEVSSTPQSVQAYVAEYVFSNPWISLGGVALAGVALGLLLGGRRRKRRARRYRASHRALVDTYLDTVGEEVHRAVAKGRDAESAVRAALRERTPLVVHYAADEHEESALAQGVDLVGKTLLAWGVREAAARFASPYLPDGGAHDGRAHDDEGGSAAVISAVSEET